MIPTKRQAIWTIALAATAGCGESDEPCTVAPGERGVVEEVVHSGGTGCVRYSSGEVWCWGDGSVGQLGNVTVSMFTRVPVPVVDLPCAVEVVVGCARVASGRVYIWGGSFLATPGAGDTPVQIDGVDDAVQITHFGALRESGEVAFWDSWHWDFPIAHEPIEYEAVGEVTALAHRGEPRCFVMPDRTARCFGRNVYGEVGDGTFEPRVEPVQVLGVADVVTVVATQHDLGCALVADGRVYCWGAGGRIGTGSTEKSSTPTPIVGVDDAVHVALGLSGGCVIHADRTVSCWGTTYRQCCRSNLQPYKVEDENVRDVIDLAVGVDGACILREDRSVWCWGDNEYGQLGHGGYEPYTVLAVKVALPGP